MVCAASVKAQRQTSSSKRTDDALYTDSKGPLGCNGPLTVASVDGKGRGLFTTRNVIAGELLLVADPLLVVYDSEDEVTELGDAFDASTGGEDELVDPQLQLLRNRLLSTRFTSKQIDWLEAMYDGTATSTDRDVRELLESASQGEQELRELPTTIDRSRLSRIVQFNSYSDDVEDEALWGLSADSDSRLRRPTGLWPVACLLNHSCRPNSVAYVWKDKLVVRATRNINKSSEVTSNYLGLNTMTPYQVRVSALENECGFSCSCTRCREESQLDSKLLQLMADISESCREQLRGDLTEAVESDSDKGIMRCMEQAQTYVELLDAAFNKMRLQENQQVLVQAAMFDVYELLFLAAAAQDQVDARLVELLQALLRETWPGSDVHLYWAGQYLEVAQQEAAAEEEEEGNQDDSPAPATPRRARVRPPNPAVQHADSLSYLAHSLRYGKISKPLYRRLLAARAAAQEHQVEDHDHAHDCSDPQLHA